VLPFLLLAAMFFVCAPVKVAEDTGALPLLKKIFNFFVRVLYSDAAPFLSDGVKV
jgi:hypothetical protein